MHGPQARGEALHGPARTLESSFQRARSSKAGNARSRTEETAVREVQPLKPFDEGNLVGDVPDRDVTEVEQTLTARGVEPQCDRGYHRGVQPSTPSRPS